jgi:hypothetical protein
MQAKSAYEFLTKDALYGGNDKRAFVMSESTFAGSGNWTGAFSQLSISEYENESF